MSFPSEKGLVIDEQQVRRLVLFHLLNIEADWLGVLGRLPPLTQVSFNR